LSDLASETTSRESWDLIAVGDAQTALKTSVGGQFTKDILPPSEQHLFGGTRFGRGFFAGQIAGDRALGATVELQLNVGFDDLMPLNPDGRRNVQFYSFSTTAGLTTSSQEVSTEPLIPLASARAAISPHGCLSSSGACTG
jgi:hemolysin activation/secretion protein